MSDPEHFDLAREEAQLARDLAAGQNPAGLAARATTRLIAATLALTAETRGAGRKMIWLTVALVALTVALVVLTGVLVWLEVSRVQGAAAAAAWWRFW